MKTTQKNPPNSSEHFGDDLVHIINCIAEPVFIKDQDHRWVLLNDAYCKLMGFSREELIGKTDMDFFPPYQVEHFWEKDNEVIQTGIENTNEEEFTDASGNIHIIITKKILFTNSDCQKFVVGIINDITERKAWVEKIQKLNSELELKVQKRTVELISANQKLQQDLIERNKIEHALRMSESSFAAEKELLAVTVGSIGDGVISTDTDGMIVMMNKVAQDLTGWSLEEVKGKPLDTVYQIIDEFTKCKCENPVRNVLKTGTKPDIVDHTILVSRSGKEFNISFSCAPICDKKGKVIGAVLVFRDTTEKRKLVEKLSKADKLESLGVLAGGIAHDFNNLLTGIFGFVNLAKFNIDSNQQQTQQYLQEATKVLGRAQGLARQLLTFSKGGMPLKKVVSLEPLLRNNASFVLSGTDIDCQFDISKDLWNCEVDEDQIEQVIDNIIINARQAMISGGTLRIKAENIVISDEVQLTVANGNYVKISITDNGPGIPPEVLPRIFDPFFTTKPGGSGLGLATAYSIIKRHNGFIDITSQIGNGATFQVHIPATTKATDTKNTEEPKFSLRKGNILLMDDEEYIRLAASELLKRIGYKVTTARNGSEVIDLYKCKSGTEEEFLVLILDLTIQGGMGGLQALKILKNQYPEIVAIASSGYSDDPVMAYPQEHGFCGALHKPYTLTELVTVLDKLNG